MVSRILLLLLMCIIIVFCVEEAIPILETLCQEMHQMDARSSQF